MTTEYTPAQPGIPVLVRAEPAPRPWFRQPRTWIIAGAVAALSVVALVAGLIALSPSGPSAVLSGDGFKVVMTMDHSQLKAIAGKDQDSQMGLSMIDSIAYGTRGSQAEAVVQLTSSGKSMLANPLMAGVIAGAVGQDGVTAHVDGGDLIVSGPASALGSSGLLNGNAAS
jgi:hypothetical protein